ncbi:MAG: hypothetical protein ACXABO_14445 [Promethearchaeota archaeon]|jgi:hypothetical protein
MQEFKVNDYLSLKLKGEETFIYVKGEKFLQCKYLLLNIPVSEISTFDEIKSIDEAAELLDNSLEPDFDEQQRLRRVNKIPPDVEFWGHCSNLQVWAEANYNSRLLHRNLAFPLLKKLSDVGDPIAKKIFKEEIAKRIIEGEISTVLFLVKLDFLTYLTSEEIDSIFQSPNFLLFDKILRIFNHSNEVNFNSFSEADELYNALGKYLVKLVQKKLILAFKQNNFEDLILLVKMLNPLDDSDLQFFINDERLNLIQNIVKVFSNKKITHSELSSRIFYTINRLASYGINDQLQEIIRKENPVELKTAIEIGLFQHINENELRRIVNKLYEPLLICLIGIDEISDYEEGYLFSVEPIEKALFEFINENYFLASSSLKRIFQKSIKENHIKGLATYFDDYSLLGNIIKKRDFDFYYKTQVYFSKNIKDKKLKNYKTPDFKRI